MMLKLNFYVRQWMISRISRIQALVKMKVIVPFYMLFPVFLLIYYSRSHAVDSYENNN